MTAATRNAQIATPQTLVFADDGRVPNNPLPLLIYAAALPVGGDDDPEAAFERLFGRNGWGDMWRDGIFDYLHYHATVHEALGIARGHAEVRFGGDNGRTLRVTAGDVVVLPAGTGHQRIAASDDFSVVGAYPPGPQMEVTRPTPENHRTALVSIPKVPLPPSDPVSGKDGPLTRIWAARTR